MSAIPLTQERTDSARFDFPFYLVLAFLLLEYGRPQSFFPFIEALHPGWFIQGALFFYLISRRVFDLRFAQTKCFVLLLLIMVIHVPIAVNNYFAFKALRNMFLYFIVFLSIANFVNSFPKLIRFIDFWIIVNLVCAYVGILNDGKVPNSGFMGDENDFALVMNMAIPFAYFMFLQAERVRRKILYLFAAGVFVIASVASLSRGGFIGLAAAGLFCWLYSPKKLGSSVVITVLVAVLFLTAPPTYWDEISTIQDEIKQEGTGGERLYAWKCGWQMFLDYPIIGVGQANFPWNFQQYEPPGGYGGRLHGGRQAHSIYFTLIPELGIIGTILFGTLLCYSLRGMKVILRAEKTLRLTASQSGTEKNVGENLRQLKYIILGVQGALASYFVSGIFLSVLYFPHFWILMAFSVAIINAGEKVPSELPSKSVTKGSKYKAIIPRYSNR